VTGVQTCALPICWAVSDSRAAFEQALRERGLILAKGDRRGHVAVTHEGEVLSVARYVGKKTKDVRAKLGEPDALPSVDAAKAQIVQDMDMAFARHLLEAEAKHKQAMAPLESERQAMTLNHRRERIRIDTAQKERWSRESRARQQRFNKGLRGVWNRLTGQHSRTRKHNEQEAYAALQRDRQQRRSLVDAQLSERQSLQSHIREARQRHAILLSQLHKDRERYRQLSLEALEAAHSRPPRKSDRRRTANHRRDTDTLRSEFKRKSTATSQARYADRTPNATSSEDRLSRLRRGKDVRKPRGDRGPEQER